MAARRRGRSLGSLFVVLGLVAVLGGTFAAGFLAGRHGERVGVVAGLVKPQAGKEPGRERIGATKPSEPAPPSLTFYQELTAPLASLPPRPKESPRPGKSEPPRLDAIAKPDPAAKPDHRADAAHRADSAPRPEKSDAAAKVDARAHAASKSEPTAKTESSTAAARASGPFTVQVGAYATRAQADALADRLTARRFQADVSETTTPNGVRYRVRSGNYPTKEAAREAAARLGADVRLHGFVTSR